MKKLTPKYCFKNTLSSSLHKRYENVFMLFQVIKKNNNNNNSNETKTRKLFLKICN